MRGSSLRLTLSLLALLAVPAGAQEPASLQVIPWTGYDPTSPLDRGRGVVAFHHGPNASGALDSLPIRHQPAVAAPIAAVFLQQARENSPPYLLAASPGLSANLVEFEYEIVGLPVDSLDPRSTWARVIYAFDHAREPQYGWVALDTAVAQLILWADFLPTRDLFLADSVPWTFTDQPLGSPLTFPPPANPQDYVLHPLARRGEWLQVRVVVPDDSCQDPQPGTRTAVGWLRFLDTSGRPRLWFFPRGC